MALTIVAQIKAAPGKEDLVREELKKLIDTTRAEEGCLQYDLHEDNATPGHFVFFENWENRELWRQHMEAPHLAAYVKATEGAVSNFVLTEMTKIA